VAPTDVPSRDELVQAWGDTVLARLRPKAKALYQAGRFVGVERGRAVFGLPNEIHRQRCDEVRSDVEAALSEHFGRPVPLVLVVDGGDGGDGGDAPLSAPLSAPPPGRSSTTGGSAARRPSTGPVAAGRLDVPPAGNGERNDSQVSAAGAGGVAATTADDEEEFLDESELGEVVDVDTSAEARVLEVFPGAEEVR
jgi:DNA polymerase-3 subunit gamma/tau